MSATLDLDELAGRATESAQQWRPGTKIAEVRPLTGGASSLTFLADASAPDGGAETPLVLKVAPPGLAPVRNRDVMRQAKLLHAIYGQPGVLVPEVYFEDAGSSLTAPPFMGMRLIEGSCYEPVLAEDRSSAPPPTELHARGLDAARMLADLHRIVPAEVGLADEPVMSLGDEIDRWTRAFTTVADDLRPDYERAAQTLHDTMPPALPPSITHGDYRLGNTLCVGDHLNSIIDWEIWAVGDPRVDLTWLMYFADDGKHPASPTFDPTGVPTVAETRAAYESARGIELPDMDWFIALTLYKEAAATALLVKRARKAGAMTASFERMAPALPIMIQDAISLASR